MNAANQGAKQYIYYDPERVDFSVTPEELTRLEAAGSNLWKDICLVCAPLGLSCLINAIAATTSPFKLDLSMFLNYLIGIVGIASAVVFAIAWRRSASQFSIIVAQIKSKPKMEIAPSTSNIGQIGITHPV
jgi:hypothetical protein